jgi:DNA-binding response OmpR family regulator
VTVAGRVPSNLQIPALRSPFCCIELFTGSVGPSGAEDTPHRMQCGRTQGSRCCQPFTLLCIRANGMNSRPRLLFVDDESSIRALMPAVLQRHGFEVTGAATVSEALNLIASRTFDVLVSDLNIGEPGDGFTVVSAMRRTQPDAATFILTGYPAFESALEAIRQQVDDYFVKPADVEALVSRILARLGGPPSEYRGIPARRLPKILEEHRQVIFSRWLDSARTDECIKASGLSDEQLADHVTVLIDEVITASSDLTLSPDALVAARRHGQMRLHQGCSVVAMIREAHILHGVLCLVVQENLLSADISFLVTDIMRIGEAVQGFLEESLHTYFDVQRAGDTKERPNSSVSVLLLSEDPELSQLREYALRKSGYSVARASSRQEALKLLGRPFDALVIACPLTHENIQEFAEHFRGENPNAPIVGVVKGAWQDLKVELDASVRGDDGPEVLLEALATALNRKPLRLIK